MGTATFSKKPITVKELERVSRMYNTSTTAAKALGVNMNTYVALCTEHEVESPAERNRRSKPQGRRKRYQPDDPRKGVQL